MDTVQLDLFPHETQIPTHTDDLNSHSAQPFRGQLLKWIGNKQRFSHEIISYFPPQFGTYYEPFLGSGAVLGTLAPHKAVASDVLGPLIEIWNTLSKNPEQLKEWYRKRWEMVMAGNKKEGYEKVKASYNKKPNGADLLFLSRSCYGGVVRFRQADRGLSTPCGVHSPIKPESFDKRVDVWHERTKHTVFLHSDFQETLEKAVAGDIVYCDPPYSETQSILYGAQSFKLLRLFEGIQQCKNRGVNVILSIDGTKKSGNLICDIPIPEGLFEREVSVNCGRSMLKRFQMAGKSLEKEVIRERLLLTY